MMEKQDWVQIGKRKYYVKHETPRKPKRVYMYDYWCVAIYDAKSLDTTHDHLFLVSKMNADLRRCYFVRSFVSYGCQIAVSDLL